MAHYIINSAREVTGEALHRSKCNGYRIASVEHRAMSCRVSIMYRSLVLSSHLLSFIQRLISTCQAALRQSRRLFGPASPPGSVAVAAPTVSGLHTTAVSCRTGRFKITPKADFPLTYEQFQLPYQIGITKSWNTWNASRSCLCKYIYGSVHQAILSRISAPPKLSVT